MMNLFTVLSEFFPDQKTFDVFHKRIRVLVHVTNRRNPSIPVTMMVRDIEYRPHGNDLSLVVVRGNGSLGEEKKYHWDREDHHFTKRTQVSNLMIKSSVKLRGAKQVLHVYAHDSQGTG